MKKFLKKILITFGISLLLSISIYIVFLIKKTPSIDRYYGNFTTIHNGSVITGTSRGRYALDYKNSTFKNFSFTRSMSPYNDSYTNFLFNVIEQKIGETSILTVSPIALGNDEEFDEELEYFQRFNFKRSDFQKINFNYLIKEKITPLKIIDWNTKELIRKLSFGKDYSKDYRDSSKDTLILNRDIKNYPIPKELSLIKLKNLGKLIHHFKKTSNVFLVRLPVPKKMYGKENEIHPYFNYMMDSISNTNCVDYIDMNNFKFYPKLIFYDVHHVNLKERKRVTQKLLDSIIEINKLSLIDKGGI